jgi:dephospho-CoA kinase
LLKEKLISRLDAIARGAVVVDAALLFSWPDILSHVDIPVLVKADDDYRERRVGEKGIDRETYLNIQNMQKSDEETEPHARYVITNNGSLEDLRMQCQKVYEEIISDC